jgi:hypothetical protein
VLRKGQGKVISFEDIEVAHAACAAKEVVKGKGKRDRRTLARTNATARASVIIGTDCCISRDIECTCCVDVLKCGLWTIACWCKRSKELLLFYSVRIRFLKARSHMRFITMQ